MGSGFGLANDDLDDWIGHFDLVFEGFKYVSESEK